MTGQVSLPGPSTPDSSPRGLAETPKAELPTLGSADVWAGLLCCGGLSCASQDGSVIPVHYRLGVSGTPLTVPTEMPWGQNPWSRTAALRRCCLGELSQTMETFCLHNTTWEPPKPRVAMEHFKCGQRG